MLVTKELETYIKTELNNSEYKKELLKDLKSSYIFTDDTSVIKRKFGPFTIICSDDFGYHKFGIGDYGELYKDVKTYNLFDICFLIYWDISFRLSTPPIFTVSDFKGDWRRWSFKKRLEILASIDKKYELKGQQVINEILKENPYNDDLFK